MSVFCACRDTVQLSTVDAPTLWQSTQADNLVKAQDMKILAYFWDTLKLEKVQLQKPE